MIRWLLIAAGVMLACPALSADAPPSTAPGQAASVKAAITDIGLGVTLTGWFQKLQKATDDGNCEMGVAALEEGRTDRASTQAYTWLGNLAERGDCMPQDYALAAEYYGEAILRHGDDARLFLGNLYLKGLGVEQDTARARRLFRQYALNLIRADPQYRVPTTKMSRRGGVPAEMHAELEWLAGLPTDRDSLLATARRLRDGDGFDRDLHAALLWYKKAMGEGSAEARHELAIMLIDDSGAPNDLYEGGYLLDQSADKGYGPSQMEQARRLARGDDGGHKYDEAYFWYLRALDNGMDVKGALDTVAMELSFVERYKIAKNARDPSFNSPGGGLRYPPPIPVSLD